MGILYSTRGLVNRWLPSGEITGASRPAASALASTDTIEISGHGFETGDPLTVRAVAQGSLPAPLVAGTVYYAIRLTNSTFKVSATVSGSPIDLTTDGVTIVVMREPPYADVIEFYSRFVDGFMPAHVVPFSPVPKMVEVLVSELSAKKLLNLDGKASETVNAAELAAKAQLERFAKGIPLRALDAPVVSANRSINATLGLLGTKLDPRGWGSGSLP